MFPVFITLLSAAGYVVMYLYPGPISHLGGICQGIVTLMLVAWLKENAFKSASLITNCAIFFLWAMAYIISIVLLACTPLERQSFMGSTVKIVLAVTMAIAVGIVMGVKMNRSVESKSGTGVAQS